ncbi:DRTGG domain-containing protein [Tepidiforma sp.]|uniref:DRTGG domain-containing protein n=1 Tax=Tepidiforma sp. TaxID=2682230 RepID=UPI002ADE88B3|nr:DRTGG domain-containing protein [Tepidiforma sp.]
MTLLYVTSAQPGQGRTGVAAALARHFAYAGQPTRLVRLEEPEANAAADAAWFATLEFAPGSPASPQAAVPAADGELLVVEGPSAAIPAGAQVVFVQRKAAPASFPAGTAACVVTAVPRLRGARRKDGTPALVELGEDRTLAGFALDEALALLHGQLIVPGDVPPDATSDHLVIAPIGSDAGQPYFRRFPSMTVVARFDRTDMHLAALRASPNALILTGGRQPSGYTIDAASASGVPVVLSRTDTENTVIALERVFERTRFRGERKLERMAELLDSVEFAALVGVPAPAAS